MAPAPVLTDSWVPGPVRGVVLVLHGGAQHGTAPIDGRSLSWRRARALARHLRPTLRAEGLGIVVLRYGVRGWNASAGGEPSPVADARWALDRIAAEHDVPVAVLGHSMGARTGVAIADRPCVRGVVALAPWLPAGEPVAPLRGKVLRAAHGSGDRITSAHATRAYVDRASAVADAEFTDMGPVGHYLLRDVRRWNAWASAALREVLTTGS